MLDTNLIGPQLCLYVSNTCFPPMVCLAIQRELVSHAQLLYILALVTSIMHNILGYLQYTIFNIYLYLKYEIACPCHIIHPQTKCRPGIIVNIYTVKTIFKKWYIYTKNLYTQKNNNSKGY